MFVVRIPSPTHRYRYHFVGISSQRKSKRSADHVVTNWRQREGDEEEEDWTKESVVFGWSEEISRLSDLLFSFKFHVL